MTDNEWQREIARIELVVALMRCLRAGLPIDDIHSQCQTTLGVFEQWEESHDEARDKDNPD